VGVPVGIEPRVEVPPPPHHSEFARHRANVATSVVEDAESEVRIRGELSEPVPASWDEDDADDLTADNLPDTDAVMKDAADVFRAAGLGGERNGARADTAGRRSVGRGQARVPSLFDPPGLGTPDRRASAA
jgi:hypothetical protein